MAKKVTRKDKIAKKATNKTKKEESMEATATIEAAADMTAQSGGMANVAEVLDKAKCVKGDLAQLVAMLGDADKAMAAIKDEGARNGVTLFSMNTEEPDELGARIDNWSNARVLFVPGRNKWLVFGDKEVFQSYCDFLGEKQAQFLAFKSLRGALEEFKRREAKHAEFEAARAERIAAYAAMNLLDTEGENTPWTPMDKMVGGELAKVILNMEPRVGEMFENLAQQLELAAGSVEKYVTDLKEKLATAGELAKFDQYRDAALRPVQDAWRKENKPTPHVKGLALLVRRGREGKTFGCITLGADAKLFIAECDKQWAAKQAEVEARFRANSRNEGRTFEPRQAPRVNEMDPVSGLVNHLLFFKPMVDAEEAAEAKRDQSLTVSLGRMLGARDGEDFEQAIRAGRGWKTQGRREKGDRRHGKRA